MMIGRMYPSQIRMNGTLTHIWTGANTRESFNADYRFVTARIRLNGQNEILYREHVHALWR